MLLLPLLTTRMSLPLMAIPMRRRLQRPSRPQYRHSDQLHHRATEEVRNPDARPVKGKAEWTIAYSVSAEHRACAESFVTLSLLLFATQMLVPSVANATGRLPTLKVPTIAPSLDSFVTESPFSFATQILAGNQYCLRAIAGGESSKPHTIYR